MNDPSEFFRQMTLRICGSLDIEEALGRSFEYLKNHLPADAMGLGYTDPSSRNIRTMASTMSPGARPLLDEGQVEQVLSPELADRIEAVDWPSHTVVNRPDEGPGVLLSKVFPGLQASSAIFLRLDIDEQQVGVLMISANGHERYRESDADLLESIREPFAVAMINARRYMDLQTIRDRLAEDHRALAADMERALGFEVVGADLGLPHVMDVVREIARSRSPTLLLGETGTGKEVIANAIHKTSPRSRGPIISMQCGAVPESLFDSELFGHEKGAFTGASQRKRGRFERADGGTLFLDEIGELSLEAQVKLLRVLQEQRFERVGGTETLEVDVRVVAATHRNLESMVQEGTFREDLWYRLNVLPIQIPPLRARPEDIPALVRYFVERKTREMGLVGIPSVAAREIERLVSYHWPGNVRELQNLVERALILHRGGELLFPDLGPTPKDSLPRRVSSHRIEIPTLDELAASHIRSVLESVGWRISGSSGAAKILGLNPNTLRSRMAKLGIRRPSLNVGSSAESDLS